MLDRVTNKVYEWEGHSTNQHNELRHLLKDVYEEEFVIILQIHAIWWLSRGNVMTRLL